LAIFTVKGKGFQETVVKQCNGTCVMQGQEHKLGKQKRANTHQELETQNERANAAPWEHHLAGQKSGAIQ